MRIKRGFTLIELMVVIVIIGIIAAVSFIAFGDFGASRKAKVTGEGFATYLQLVRQRAILETNAFGISFSNTGYETLKFQDSKQWIALPQNSLFHFRTFPTHVLVKLHSNLYKKSNMPDIIIYPSGDITEFELDFGTKESPSVITITDISNGQP